jgi:sulfatase maturation enzyme AslB (radical SAM superfamily)
MFFKRKSNVIFRDYISFGYIVDSSIFGYKKINADDVYIGDKILSESGSVFFSVLDRVPQSIDDLAKKINGKYIHADIATIKDDAREFYFMLERDGFVVSGEKFYECKGNDKGFSYKTLAPDTLRTGIIRNATQPQKTTLDFFEAHFNGKPRLTNLHIEITSKCNERCIHCYIPHEKKIEAIDPDLFYDAIAQCRDMRVLHLTLSGGEPMMHKNFCDFLRRCREYDFSVSVLTNLTLLSDDIVKEMKENCLLGVQASLYSMDPDIHDEITK